MSEHDKKILDKIHAKHYGAGKQGKKAKQEAKVKKVIKDKKAAKALEQPKVTPPEPVSDTSKAGVGITEQAKTPKIGTRAALMAEAQKRGIKYFRILSKGELTQALNIYGSGEAPVYIEQEIDKIIRAAQKRWKSGWTKKGAIAKPAKKTKEVTGGAEAATGVSADPKLGQEPAC